MNIKLLKNTEEKYFLALLSAASVLRKEKKFRQLLEFAKVNNFRSEKIYEVLIQTYLFAGFPNALVSLKIFSQYYKPPVRLERYDIVEFTKRGIRNCKKVYGKNFEKLISNVASFSSDLSEWLILEGYGKTLGRRGLNLKERELCIISILSVLKYEDQLISHLKGAHRCGNSVIEIKRTIKNINLIGEKYKSEWALNIFLKMNF